MFRLGLIFIAFFINSSPVRATEITIDLSTPQRAYETCYGTVNFQSPRDEVRDKIKKCLTPTAQKAVLSYTILGAYYVDSLKDKKGQKKHPNFLAGAQEILNRYELLGASRMAFQKADLPSALADLLTYYAAQPMITDNLGYKTRTLKILSTTEQAARAKEIFKLNNKLPINSLELAFVKVKDKWLINYISHL